MIFVQILPSAVNVFAVESCRILQKLLLIGNQPSSQERHLQSPQAVLRKLLVAATATMHSCCCYRCLQLRAAHAGQLKGEQGWE